LADTNIALFVEASLAVTIAPGPDNVYVLTRGVVQGREEALILAWGMCSGLLFQITMAAVGLGHSKAVSNFSFRLPRGRGCFGSISGVFAGEE
jgi:threonine/homoserine/homoserine lactone efflux protein